MLERGVDSSGIALITFYKEQHRYLEDFAKETGIDISTVDSVQGRQCDVVILLTTKTDSFPDASEFLDAPRRMNVALTRCRHGQMNKTLMKTLKVGWKQGLDCDYMKNRTEGPAHKKTTV
ncbi:hypothetical protein ANCDUO_18992 [Ancylostoma duodenale]|uniref:DNA2/NAM7 helicase-like C-terminal domain-containing protein n=1 Tax=Ancylostoma duodenale TaxID=51022 RepID=A0A0C2FWB9_9BILA|nr:hypothetical protein ANCDUO_18992 [Ancylostoma duodenale]